MDPSIHLLSHERSPQDNSVVHVRDSGWVRIVRGPSTREKRWGLCPKRSASSEGQGSSWPWLPTASSSWREISHRESGVWGKKTWSISVQSPWSPSLKRWGGLGHLRPWWVGLCAPTVLEKPGGCTAVYDLSPDELWWSHSLSCDKLTYQVEFVMH